MMKGTGLLVCAVGALALGGGARGGVEGLFGATWVGDFYEIDVATGERSLVGSLGLGRDRINAMAASPDRSTIYGALLNIDDPTSSALVTIDPVSGSIASRVELQEASDIRGLTFVGDDTLVAVRSEGNGSSHELVKIDPATGGVSAIDRVLDGSTPILLQSLVTRPDSGVPFGWSFVPEPGLYTVDPLTGDAVRIEPPEGALEVQAQSLEFLPSGRLLAVDPFGLYEVDPDEATFELIGQLGGATDLRGLAFVPGPGTVGAALVLGVAGLRRRRG